MNQAGTTITTAKPHYEILDGLRGVAALAVVVFHFMEWVHPDLSKNFIAHGFLAVDFFFCLSGFVIGYAYDDRIQRMGILEFFKARAIRLHPLVVIGSVLGLLAFLFDPFGGNPALYSAGKIILLFVCSALLIPFPVMEERGLNLFGLNAPSWSLFWEYVANIAYAFILCKIKRNALIVLVILAGIALSYVSYSSGNLLGGWRGPTFLDGFARIAYSFLAGILIHRSNWIIRNKLGFAGMAVLLAMAFLMPFTPWSWLTELLVVLCYFPLLIALGAGAVLNKAFKKLCLFSGKISYPLYMTHYAVLWIFGNYFTNKKPDNTTLVLIIAGGTILVLVMAYLVMLLADLPIRKYLDNKRKAKLIEKNQAGI